MLEATAEQYVPGMKTLDAGKEDLFASTTPRTLDLEHCTVSSMVRHLEPMSGSATTDHWIPPSMYFQKQQNQIDHYCCSRSDLFKRLARGSHKTTTTTQTKAFAKERT